MFFNRKQAQNNHWQAGDVIILRRDPESPYSFDKVMITADEGICFLTGEHTDFVQCWVWWSSIQRWELWPMNLASERIEYVGRGAKAEQRAHKMAGNC